MRFRKLAQLGVVCLVLGVFFGLLPLAVGATQRQQPQEHVIVAGETLYSIAARYGIHVQTLADANGITNLEMYLRPGTALIVPAPPGQTGKIHVVRRGEYLVEIAQMYGVTVRDLVLANNLSDANQVFVSQRLFIPVVTLPTLTPAARGRVTFTPTPSSTPTPVTPPLPICRNGCEVITILSPTMGMTVTNPITVTGFGYGNFEQTLVVRVLDGTGFEVGKGYAIVGGELGDPGPFTTTVTYTAPASTQPGRIQVYSLDPRDGAIAHLNSVVVTLQGLELDAVIEQLKEGLETKNYEALANVMSDPWLLGFYRFEGIPLPKEEALNQLMTNYLEPGDVFVDLSVDAKALLGSDVVLPPGVVHMLYSTGWGPDQVDDAFLLLVQDEQGLARWGGMIYVFDALRDYSLPR